VGSSRNTPEEEATESRYNSRGFFRATPRGSPAPGRSARGCGARSAYCGPSGTSRPSVGRHGATKPDGSMGRGPGRSARRGPWRGMLKTHGRQPWKTGRNRVRPPEPWIRAVERIDVSFAIEVNDEPMLNGSGLHRRWRHLQRIVARLSPSRSASSCYRRL